MTNQEIQKRVVEIFPDTIGKVERVEVARKKEFCLVSVVICQPSIVTTVYYTYFENKLYSVQGYATMLQIDTMKELFL